MKVKNQTDVPVFLFGLHFAPGHEVDVPDDLREEKKQHLARIFEVVDGPKAEPVPKVVPRKTTKRRRSTFRSD